MRPAVVALSLAAVVSAAQPNNNEKREMHILPIGHTTVNDQGETIINNPLEPLVPKTSSAHGPKIVTRPNPTVIPTTAMTTPTMAPPSTTPTSAPPTSGSGGNATITSTGEGGVVTTITSAVGGGPGGDSPSSSDGGATTTSPPDDAAPHATPFAGAAALLAAVGVAMAL